MKLYYFDVKGRGELCRLILHAKQIPFEDIRITKEQWPEYKPKMPFQQLPVLEIDGKLLPESMAISRFLANKYNLSGETELEKALADAIVDYMHIAIEKIYSKYFTSESEEKEKVIKETETETIPKLFETLSKFMKTHGDPDHGHLVGKNLTWADIFCANITNDILNAFFKADMSKYPDLEKCIANVNAVHGIAEYLKIRPKTQY